MKVRPLSLLKYEKDINLVKLYFDTDGMERANELLTLMCDNKKDDDVENDPYIKQLLSIGASCYYTFNKLYSPSYDEYSPLFLDSLEGKIIEDTSYPTLIKMFNSIKTGIRCDENFDEFNWKSFPNSVSSLLDTEETNRIRNIIFLKNDKVNEYLKSFYKNI